MNLHTIHNSSESIALDLLKTEFSFITDPKYIVNYHPDYSTESSNFFYILEQGRYREGHGKYMILEENSEYICSAGWNEYDLNIDIALVLTRMYVNKKYRAQYMVGEHILPILLNDTETYSHVWITSNQYNKSIYRWFERNAKGKNPALFNNWPDIYKQFEPIGQMEVYHTMQDVVELKRK
jgi:hypothetical protein